MTVRYKKTSRDANHGQITRHLENHGLSVIDLAAVGGGIPDILVTRPLGGEAVLMEIKVPGSRAKWRRSQLEWLSNPKNKNFKVVIATSPEEALYKLREKRFVTERQRGVIASFLYMNEGRDEFQPSELEKIFNQQ